MPARSERQPNAPTAEIVDNGPILRRPDRVVEWPYVAPRTQADAPCLGAQAADEQDGVRIDPAEPLEVTFREPYGTKAMAVRESRRLGEEVVLVMSRGVAVGREVEHAEIHVPSPGLRAERRSR
jgi:hypothetical protein